MRDETADDAEVEVLLQRAAEGDAEVLGQLLQRFRDRLLRLVQWRLDRRLSRRIDPSDVVQEAFVSAALRFAEYCQDPRRMPFFLWLRFLAMQKVLELHRTHFQAQARDVNREVPLGSTRFAEATSALLIPALLASQTSPSQAAVRAELEYQLHASLRAMDPIDQEIITLRNFEQLSNAEAAQVLEISDSAASNRYMRALKRLKCILEKSADPNPKGPDPAFQVVPRH